jgi:hypothetical protein
MVDGKWILEVVADSNDDLVLQLPDEFCAAVEWNIGDTIKWIDNGDGTWSLKKINEEHKNSNV